MSITNKSLFVPGARVVVEYGMSHAKDYREDIVDKVYKNGNFSLVGGKGQQWRPFESSYGLSNWMARKTGKDLYSHSTVFLWDKNSNAKITTAVAASNRRNRHERLALRFKGLRFEQITDAMLDAIEQALPPTGRNKSAS